MERFPILALLLIGAVCLAIGYRLGSYDIGWFGLASLTGGLAYAGHVYPAQIRAFLDRIGGHR